MLRGLPVSGGGSQKRSLQLVGEILPWSSYREFVKAVREQSELRKSAATFFSHCGNADDIDIGGDGDDRYK